jgi:protein SCO1/2
MPNAAPSCRNHSPFRPRQRLLCATLVLVLCAPTLARAADPPPHPPLEHVHQHPAASAADDGTVGLDEHLGAKLPLELTFRDESGQNVTLRELIDGPTLILPVYYSCTNVCNFLQGGLARTLPALKLDADRQYRVLSISFDETETFELAARYRKTYYDAIGAPYPEKGWRFLTGDAANIRAFTSAIGYRFRREGHDFVHPVASVVVAGDGTIIRYLYGTNFLPKDVTLALVEAGEGRVGPTIRKVVEFCFSYDPAQKTYVFNLLRVAATAVILTVFALFLFLLFGGRKKSGKRKS